MADIELVIKIPEEIYKSSQILDVKHEDVIQIPLEVIANGTPLPKGHGRLIDIKQIVTKDECIWNSDGSCTTITTYDIDSTSTIIEADKAERKKNEFYKGWSKGKIR